MNQPRHIAIIMDGNGRWAQLRGKPRTYGHIKGAKVVKKLVKYSSKIGLKHLTLYAFSSENWHRPVTEVSFLMSLLERYLRRERDELHKQNVRVQAIGELHKLPPQILNQISEIVDLTKDNTGLNLVFALSYGGRQEITNSMRELAELVKCGKLNPSDIDEETVQSHLYTNLPDPDLIIRTSGEQRISNFLLWQSAYSEFYFTNTLWPDFTEKNLDQAISSFLKRDRRFGTIPSDELTTN